MAVAATSGTSVTDKINNSRTSLANNEQTFLKLLTTQLKNQDPLSPTDTTQMTSQITQMTGVEQQLVTNDLLTALVGMNTSGGISDAVNLMGKQVTAETDKSVLKDNAAAWTYTQGRSATSVKIEIVDKYDKTIRTVLPEDMSSGDHTFTWDGKTTGGEVLTEGVYTLKVSAMDSKNANVASQALTKGRVKGVEMYNGAPYLVVGETILPLSTVISLNEIADKSSNDDTENPDVPTEEAAA